MITSISFCILGLGRDEGLTNRAIASVLRQRLPNPEILVCGELSAANNAKVLRSNGWSESGELNRIRNMLCANATKDFVVLMVDSIELSDGWYEAIKEADYLDIIASRIVTNDGIRAVDWAYPVKLGAMTFPYPLDYDEWTTKAYVSGSFMVLRKRAWERIKFDETLLHGKGDDVDFCLRATNAGFRVGVIPQAEGKYHVTNSATTIDVTFEKSRSVIVGFKRALATGRDAFNSGDYELALLQLTKAAEIAPDDPRALSFMGWAHYFTRRYEKSLEIFGHALALDAKNHFALRGRGWALLQTAAYAGAVNDLTAALHLVNPDHRDDWVETVRGLAWSHYHNGSFGEAKVHFNALLEKSKKDERGLLQDVYRGLGWCCYRQGTSSEAASHFEKALSNIDPKEREFLRDAKHGLELAAAGQSGAVGIPDCDRHPLVGLPGTYLGGGLQPRKDWQRRLISRLKGAAKQILRW